MSITVSAVTVEVINFAACHCGYLPVQSVRIQGGAGQKLILRIYSEPAFLFEYKEELIPDSDDVQVMQLKLQLDVAFYRQEFLEAGEGTIKVELIDGENPEKVLAFDSKPVHLQPYLHWDRIEMLVTFMQPNSLLVAKILNRAGELANESGGRMVGYFDWTNTDAVKQAEWIYQALQEENIHYLCPPPGYEIRGGQKVRIPQYLLNKDIRQGTCLDLAVLYASCLEAASLHSVLFIVPGHAFAGVWTDKDASLSEYCCSNAEEVKNVCRDGKLVPVECTVYTDGLNVDFQSAVDSGLEHVEGAIDYVLDVELGRKSRYLPAFTATEVFPESMHTEQKEEKAELAMTPGGSRITKLDRLKSQAMDFTMKNVLLAKAEGGSHVVFQLDAERFFGGEYTDSQLFRQMQESCQEARMDAETLENQLYALQNADRQMYKTNGRRILYLCVDELEWLPKGQETLRHAPLYLCPAEIYRNIRGEYVFKAKADELFLNPVLSEYLQQNYGIDLTAKTDVEETGYAEEIKQIEYAIGLQENWKILTDTASLELCQVPNEAIWRGLSDEKLLEHDVVKGILDGAMTWENDLQTDEEAAEDEEAVYAFQADSSQSGLIRSVYRKRTQVVTGPAGNGKSQTIANIIIEQMRRGKKILFVAEKLSAMKVIADKLETAGLAPFCLMLPDGVNSLSEVKDSIASTLKYISNYQPGMPGTDAYEKRCREAAEKLHQYDEFMKTRGTCGWSLAELLDEYENYRKIPVNLPWQTVGEALNREDAMEIVLAFQEAKRLYPAEWVPYLKFIRFGGMSEAETAEAKLQAEKALQEFAELRTLTYGFEQLLNMNLTQETDKEEIKQMVTYASTLVGCPVVGSSLMQSAKDDGAPSDLLKLAREMLLTAPGSERNEQAGSRLWSQMEEISSNTDFKVRDDNELSFMEKELAGMNRGNLSMKQMNAMSSNAKFNKFQKSLLTLAKDRPEAEQEEFVKAAFKIGRGNGKEILAAARKLLGQYKQYSEMQKRASDAVLLNTDVFTEQYPNEMKTVLFREWLEQNTESPNPDKKQYQQVYRRAFEAGLGNLIMQMEQQLGAETMTIDQIPAAFEKCRCAYNIDEMRRNMKGFRDFAQMDYKVCLSRYRKNEQLMREQMIKNLPDEMMTYLPDLKEGIANSPELGILQKLIRRNGKQVSVRQIFEEAPNVMHQLFPCILMGPESVAEYIPADNPEFDMVIFDEASQMPTYKALIPISRGYQSLFIGDEKQLTPTAFFKKNVMDEDGVQTPVEAVLEDAIITSMPQHMLRGHYRSKYESLMAFSNNKYYDGEIVTFPNPDTQFKGVHWVYTEDGCYDRGGTRSNQKEAERVLELLKEIYEKLPEDTAETVGVITFNLEQMRLLQSLVHEGIHSKVSCSRQLEELVDVVNLEACQGREWDRTILSMTYGPDAEGNFSTNLGPMTRDDGGNRLNVMITRSRQELFAVTSMTPEMFSETQSGGGRDIREFLTFARGDFTFDTCNKGEGSEKEERKCLLGAVASRLEKKGYVVHTNIGSSSCKVDIGVTRLNGQYYQLGILLDDFMNSRYFVRDEEVIKPEMLKSKGWQIYRLHALNWYDNAEYELQQIEKLLMQ